ncbi:RNA polymerase sigma-70 factor, ECF subfamily [Spirosoma endophyticum]|uniref:RNA polymerase sigma-70 factor, ECF subfamily n=1 Tax=Spirosoma endophyticum TaxID=662367 RepID=A0A1I1WCQ7_9BACT|nr:RNA polymerase sigma-70 factor, ECF subfamily [Spirosoma endophyticum]
MGLSIKETSLPVSAPSSPFHKPDDIRPLQLAETSPNQPAIPSDNERFIRQAFVQNPKQGFELLFREYYSPLCSHAVRFVYSRDVARDLVSDLFAVFWQKALHEQINTSYRAYLYAAVRNRALKYLQRELGRETTFSTTEMENESSLFATTETLTPEELLRYDELYNRVEDLVQQLSPQRQKVFIMNRIEGKKYQTIAQELNVTLKTVEAHISSALSTLRKALQKDWQ